MTRTSGDDTILTQVLETAALQPGSGHWRHVSGGAPVLWGGGTRTHTTVGPGGVCQVTGHVDHINTCSSDTSYQYQLTHLTINTSTIISRSTSQQLSTISSNHGSQVGHSGVWHKQYQCCWRGEIEVFVACSLAAWQTVAAGDHIGGYSLHQDAANTTQICSRVLTKINATFLSSLNIHL